MEFIPEWGQTIIIGISIVIGGALIMWLCKGTFSKFKKFTDKVERAFQAINEIYEKIEEMQHAGRKRKDEINLLIEGQLKVFEVLEDGKVNGQVADYREKMDAYLLEQALSK